MPLTETGTLPVGVEVAGVRHTDFELRPTIAADVVALAESPWAGRAAKTGEFRGLALLSYQLQTLGTLTRDEITPDLLLTLYDCDLAALTAADGRLSRRLATFRAGGEAPAGDHAGADEARV